MGTVSKDCCLSEKPTKKGPDVHKSQSAMEYLMTYGWAILIIAIVLAALFSLGIFGSGTFTGTTCIANTGFLCSAPIAHGNTFTATMGQATGTTWNNVVLCYVPSGATVSSCTGFSSIAVGTLHSGQSVTYSFTVNSVSTSSSGSIWAQYSEKGYNNLMSQLAIATLTGLTPHPSSSHASVIGYVPVTLTNSQSSTTPAPFQQMVKIPESSYTSYIAYSGSSSNIEFTTSPNGAGTVIPAWIESNSSGTLTVWLKLSNSIAADSNTVVYLNFYPKTTNLLSSSGTTGIGEAPQLSSTYAKYDDGASVFTNYWNFAGTTLPSGWAAVGGFTQYSVNNGLTITGAETGSQGVYVGLESNVRLSPPYILETYAQYPTESLSGFDNILGVGPNNNQQVIQIDSTYYIIQSYNNGGSYTEIATSGTGIWSIIGVSSSTNYGSFNYGAQVSSTSSNPISFPANIATPVIAGFTGGLTNNIIEYYIRTRAYPPSGVMPTVTFGSVS